MELFTWIPQKAPDDAPPSKGESATGTYLITKPLNGVQNIHFTFQDGTIITLPFDETLLASIIKLAPLKPDY
jgi:hypothetical protein